MTKYAQIGILIVALLIVGGFIVLGIWDAPAPSNMMETKIDDSRFPR
jgi:hypothetical protein